MYVFRLWGIICLLLFAASAYGQGTAAPPNIGEFTPPAKEPNIQKAPLDAVVVFNPETKRSIYLPDGWPLNVLDEFHHFLFRDKQPSAVPFIIQDVSVTGKVSGNRIEANVTISLVLTGTNPNVRIPLAFREAVITSGANITVSDKNRQAFLLADGANAGYAVLLTGKDSTNNNGNAAVPLKLELPIWLPVRDNSFTVSFPQTASSSFLLQIPETGIETSVTGDVLLNQNETADKKSTELKLSGLKNITEIRWKKQDPKKTGSAAAVLTVEKAFYDYKLDAGSTVCEAVIPVSISAGGIDKLQIKMPTGTKIDKAATEKLSAGNYSLSEADKNSLVDVTLVNKTVSQITLKLKTFQSFESKDTGFLRELTGFEIIGAERQSGNLSVSIPPEMKSRWELNRGVRQTENIPVENKDAAKPAGTIPVGTVTFYEFIAQPFMLKVRAALSQTRTNVKPEFQYYISKGLLQLTGRFSYTVSGSKTDKLQIQMSDNLWNIEVGPQGLVDTVNAVQDETGLLTVPLRHPADGTFNIELRAYRLLTPDREKSPPQTKQRLSLVLPKALVTWSEPAPVIITAANDVEIQPIDAGSDSEPLQITGLMRLNRRPGGVHLDIAEGLQQEPLYYLSEPTGGAFVADMVFHRREASAAIQTEIRPCDEHSQVKQIVTYNVAYLPVDKLYFRVPKNIESGGNVQIRFGNKTLELRDVAGDTQEADSERWTKKVLQLPEPMFKFQLTVLYSIPKTVITEGVTAYVTQQFVQPVNVPVTEHRVDVAVPAGCRIELPEAQNADWTEIKDRLMLPDISAVFWSSKAAEKIVLRISIPETDDNTAAVAERAWLQTWLTGTVRQDRCTYLLSANRDTITVTLPYEAVKEQRVFVRIDSVPVKPELSATGRLTIPLPAAQPKKNSGRQICLEIDYRFDSSTLGNTVSLTPPLFENETVVRYAFWEVILPAQKYIISFPKDWIPEYRWVWQGLFFQRMPSIQKTDAGLEADPADIAAVIKQSNHYLFSSLHPSDSVTLFIADRSVLVFTSSAVSLILGLCLIYIPVLRYSGSLLGLGIVLAAVLFYRPAPMLLLLQMSVFGVCLALLAGYIHRIFSKKDIWNTGTPPLYDTSSEPVLTPFTTHETDIAEKPDTPPPGNHSSAVSGSSGSGDRNE
ncbi:MAG: hypothetical protein LBT89_09470 [Planctomycetaceae bacterium]|jgi:hypothetical protein|nr:hypothetical protein [Planctomycetaceae bacterium]